MAQEVNNFARFYAAFNQLLCAGDREDMKRDFIRQWTGDRTDSLREMTMDEYKACCEDLERLTGRKDEQKVKRSLCLKLMQKLGIDTTDWTRVNSFCQDQRIAGKVFARLSNGELEALADKLRAIQRKGGLNHKKEVKPSGEVAYMITFSENTIKC